MPMTGSCRCLAITAAAAALSIGIAPEPAEAQTSAGCRQAAREGRYPPGCPRPRSAPRIHPDVPASRGIRPGRHQCQIDSSYAYRPCTVTAIGSGRYELIAIGYVELRGQLELRGNTLVFTGRMTDESPGPCRAGNSDLPGFAALYRQCRDQGVHIVLRRSRRGWTGSFVPLKLRTVYGGSPRSALSNTLERSEDGGWGITDLTILD
jgi:hypothetical protein